MEDYKIYPKQFQFEKILIEKNKCFMIMPFDDEFNSIYGTIKETVEKQEVVCKRADEINGSQPILNKIIKGILESQYIIVDITNARPNVFYELGIAHSFRDARNILILKQKNTNYPFDISHLPYQEYESGNEYKLRAIVSTFIKESRYITDFRDSLAINDIYDYTVNGTSNYIDYVENCFKGDVAVYSHILNKTASAYDETEVESAFIKFEKFITDTLCKKNTEVIDGVIRIYIKLIERCENIELSRKFANRFMNSLLIRGMDDDAARIAKETDLMLSLAGSNKLLDLCIPWIIEYFSKSKASSIDLNRYKLENFLMSTPNECIDDAIVESIFNEDCHVREHMADIIGAKRITKGFQALKKQLIVEENWFTIGSIVVAIGRVASRINSQEGIQAIEEWIDENGNRLIAEKKFFLLKHLQHGISLLDTDDNEHIQKFHIRFKKYMDDNKISAID